MYISCNQLKKYIENSDTIDFMQVAKDFTIRSAEIDSVTIKGQDVENVVVAEVVSLEKHPENEKYTVEIIDNGYEGEGIAKIDNFTIFVPGAIKGEKVKILIVKVLSSHAFGKILEIIEKAYEYAKENHKEQVRLSGDEYITHPLNVAYILTNIYSEEYYIQEITHMD